MHDHYARESEHDAYERISEIRGDFGSASVCKTRPAECQLTGCTLDQQTGADAVVKTRPSRDAAQSGKAFRVILCRLPPVSARLEAVEPGAARPCVAEFH